MMNHSQVSNCCKDHILLFQQSRYNAMTLNMLDLTNNFFYELLLSRLFITLFSIVTA